MTMRKHVDTSAQVAMIREAARLYWEVKQYPKMAYGNHHAISALRRVLVSTGYMTEGQFAAAIAELSEVLCMQFEHEEQAALELEYEDNNNI